MKYSTLPRIKALLALIFTGRIPDMLKLLLGMFLICPILCAQQTNTPPDMNQQTAQMLLQRMDQLEANLKCTRLDLTAGEIARLDEASALPPEYPGWFLERFDSL